MASIEGAAGPQLSCAPVPPPASSRRSGILCACLAVVVCGVFYARTICPVIYWGDGMELAAAAKCLGVAHPTGYPLYTLLGHIFLDLPLGGPGLRVNLLSAVSMLVAVALLYGLAGDFFRLASPASARHPGAKHILQAGVAATFGLSWIAWMHAVQAEVYSTFAAVLIGCLRVLIRAYERRSIRDALALAFLAGIAFQSHLLAVLLLPPIGALVLHLSLPPRPRDFRRLLLAPLFCAVGLSGYLALPIRARANPPMNWGDPSNVGRFISHIRGGEYTGARFLADPVFSHSYRGKELRQKLFKRAADMLQWPDPTRPQATDPPAARSLAIGALIWLGAAMGWALLAWRRPILGLGLAGSVASWLVVGLCYNIDDIEVYFLALWPLLLVLFSCAWNDLAARCRSPLVSWSLALASVVVAGNAGAVNIGRCDLSSYTLAEDYAHDLLAPLEQGAILILCHDNTTFAAWYEQVVKGARRDVVVYSANFMFRAWYGRYFENAAARGLSLFTADAEQQPPAKWFVALGGGVIIPNIGRRPIYAASPDDWMRAVLIQNWKGSRLADLFPVDSWNPPLPASLPAASIYRLGDNPEYRKVQLASFEELFGSRWPGEKREVQ